VEVLGRRHTVLRLVQLSSHRGLLQASSFATTAKNCHAWPKWGWIRELDILPNSAFDIAPGPLQPPLDQLPSGVRTEEEVMLFET